MVNAITTRQGRRMTWKVAHACVRGSSHVRSGMPNQDAAQCTVSPPDASGDAIAVVAVSDGHGGMRHFRSQIGSSLAVSTAIAVVQQFLSRFAGEDGAANLSTNDVMGLQQTLVDSWVDAVSADLQNHPLTEEELRVVENDGPEARASVEESPALAYGATLLIAAATSNLVLFLQLGDGEVLSVAPDGETTRPLPGDDRLLGNQTTSLCQPEAWREFRSAWVITQLPAVVLLSTDGYANSFRSDEDFLKIGQDYLEILREQGIATLAEELPEILSEATRQGSGDDITLGILQGDLRKSPSDPEPVIPIKPKIANEARSALIEHLKARHSSQHRRIDDLSSRLEKTRKHNRRLQYFILLLVVSSLALCAYTLRDRLFHRQAASDSGRRLDRRTDEEKTPKRDTTGTVPPEAQAGGSRPARWELRINKEKPIPLTSPMTVSLGQMFGGTDESEYAEVTSGEKGQTVLRNNSKDQWQVKPGRLIENGQDVSLDEGPVEIKFRPGEVGKITTVSKGKLKASNQQSAGSDR